MNVSVALSISISLSGNLSAGIFFTNGTQNMTQYNLTNTLDAWNNAIYDYPDNVNGNTSYYVQAAGGNTINVTVCQCPCDDLKCKAGSGTCGASDIMNISYQSQAANKGGIFYANQTNGTITAVGQYAPSYGSAIGGTGNWSGFGLIDVYYIMGAVVYAGNWTNLRYWLDPYPNTAPSGIYNTTWNIRAVEWNDTTKGAGDCGTCVC